MARLLDTYSGLMPENLESAVALGLIPGWRTFRKFGMNEDVDTGTEDVWAAGGIRTLPTTAGVATVSSANAADTSAGTGARTVRVQGLDASYNEIQETVTLNGITGVNTTQSYIRVDRMFVETAGSNQANVGNLTLTVGGNTQAFIEDNESQTHQLGFTVPNGHYLLLTEYLIVAGRLGTGETMATLRSERLDAGENDRPWRVVDDQFLGSGAVINQQRESRLIAPKTDIRVQVTVTGNNRRVSGKYGGFLINEEYLDLTAIERVSNVFGTA